MSVFQVLWEIAERLAKNGAFDGANANQLYARILIGDALGVDPATACGNITFTRGKPVFSAAIQAALLARSSKYAMEVVEVSDERCAQRFLKDGKPLYAVVYTMDEAKRAGLASKDVWRKYPSDLLFARALTRGVKRYCPDLLVGNAAITPEEMGADAHEPIPSTIEVKPKEPEPAVAAPAAADKPKRGSITDQQLHDIKSLNELLQIPRDDWKDKVLAKRKVESARELSKEQAAELISALKTRLDIKSMKEGLAQRNGDLVVTLPGNKQKEDKATSAASKRTI
jgi:hypothetical protein